MSWFNIYEAIAPPLLRKSIRRVMSGCKEPAPPTYMIDPSIGSFSQYQEDLIIDSILGCKKEGFYVDVGANHPQLLSNTKRFYDKGWIGINIEPNPLMFDLLQKERKNDINLNIGVGNEKREMQYFLLDPDQLSTFNSQAAKRSIESRRATLEKIMTVPVSTLGEVLDSYAAGRSIDFMSIDVEGFEEEVIAGGDWKRFRPSLLMMEIAHSSNSLFDIMRRINYRLVYANGLNGIFIDDEK